MIRQRSSYVLQGLAQVEVCESPNWAHMLSGEIHTPTRWKPIDRSTIALPPVLSLSNILPPPLSH